MSMILLLPATIGIEFGVLLMAGTVFTWNQSAELLRSSAHEDQMENGNHWKTLHRPKNSVELSDIEIWVRSLFYCHFPSLTYFCIWFITYKDMQRERDYGYKGIYDTPQIKLAITIAWILLLVIIFRPLQLKKQDKFINKDNKII